MIEEDQDDYGKRRIHIRLRNGNRTTVSLDGIHCQALMALGYEIGDWCQEAYDELTSEDYRRTWRGMRGRSLSRYLQAEVVRELIVAAGLEVPQ